MSVELSGGRIKVSYDLGSGTASVISSQNHNDGKWKSFTLSRIQKQGKFLWCQHHGFSSYLWSTPNHREDAVGITSSGDLATSFV